MKDVDAWLLHPYFHLLTLGLGLVCCAIGFRSEESIEAAARPVSSRSCREADVSHHPAPETIAGDALRPDGIPFVGRAAESSS